jgi:hypothetical protein
MVTTGMIRRAEFRKHLKVQQQLKVITLVLVALLLLAAYPIYLFTQAVTADPVYRDLDGLSLPDWAMYEHADAPPVGSRWCIGECRSRSRTYASERQPQETHEAFKAALVDADWRRRAEPGCPVVEGGGNPAGGEATGDPSTDGTGGSAGPLDGQIEDGTFRSCWVKDEYVLVLHVYVPICDAPPPRENAGTGTDVAPTRPVCPAAYATLKVYNAVDYRPAAVPEPSDATEAGEPSPSAS